MEPRQTAPLWRASLGVIVTAIAAALLILSVWRIVSLNNQAGATLTELSHERTAVSYQDPLFDLLHKSEQFRLRVELQRNPPFGPQMRQVVDQQMSVVANLTSSYGQTFDLAKDWNGIQHRWAKARDFQRVYRGNDVHRLTVSIDNYIYTLEDTSGLQYESNRYAQDLSDIIFSKMPDGIHDTLYADLIVENAQTSGTISIHDRVRLAGLLGLIGGDVDLSSDDWNAFLRTFPGNLGTAADAARYRRDSDEMAAQGKHLVSALNAGVLMSPRPTGDPAATRVLAQRLVRSIVVMHADAAGLLDRQLAARMNYETLRNRYIYAIVLLTAFLLVGIMLLASEFTARRDREALNKAQQESARLSSELARQKAERALQLSEAQFRAVFDGAALGIAILDRSRIHSRRKRRVSQCLRRGLRRRLGGTRRRIRGV